MPFFDFSTQVVQTVVQQLSKANHYIRIAMFQIHQKEVFQILENKLDEGVKIEIFTLPYDSVHANVLKQVQARMENLRNKGAIIHFCRWNVGDPGRTTTAVGRWYSFHGKFIVTDKTAILLSANFTQDVELDALIIHESEKIIAECNEKFDELISLFIKKQGEFDGKIHDLISQKSGDPKIFQLPDNVDELNKKHWIRHYPIELVGTKNKPLEGLYLTPFDFKGRDLITDLIDEAEEFVYFSTESFTDEDFSNYLLRTAINRKIDIKILTGIASMDFTDRVNEMLRDLLAHKIGVNSTYQDLHAKLIITDKCLVISSINLNKINLGFYVTKKFWRENTESVFICREAELIQTAKKKFLERFSEGYNVREKLAEKLKTDVVEILGHTFGLRSTKEAKNVFAKFILAKQLDIRRTSVRIGKIAKKLVSIKGKTVVDKDDLISALILYFLSERKQDLNQLQQEIEEVEPHTNLVALMSSLKFSGLVEEEQGFYKINIDALII